MDTVILYFIIAAIVSTASAQPQGSCSTCNCQLNNVESLNRVIQQAISSGKPATTIRLTSYQSWYKNIFLFTNCKQLVLLEWLIQGGERRPAQIILTLSWFTLVEPVVPTTLLEEDHQIEFAYLTILTTLLRQLTFPLRQPPNIKTLFRVSNMKWTIVFQEIR